MSLLGDRTEIRDRTPMPVSDVTLAGILTNITSEAVSFTDGAAGTTQKLKLSYDKVLSEYGDRIGKLGDTSLSFTTGTVLTTEVEWKFKNGGGVDTDTARLATMSSGDYMVDYENGYILGKGATITSSSTDAATYKIKKSTATLTGDVQIGAVEIKNGSSDTRASVNSDNELAVREATASSLDHGSKSEISTNAAQMTTTSFAAKAGVSIKADSNNSGRVFIGNSDVTAGTNDDTDGIPLDAGESIEIEVNNPNLLYVIADSDNHKVYWIAA